jgi:hypothetical protein
MSLSTEKTMPVTVIETEFRAQSKARASGGPKRKPPSKKESTPTTSRRAKGAVGKKARDKKSTSTSADDPISDPTPTDEVEAPVYPMKRITSFVSADTPLSIFGAHERERDRWSRYPLSTWTSTATGPTSSGSTNPSTTSDKKQAKRATGSTRSNVMRNNWRHARESIEGSGPAEILDKLYLKLESPLFYSILPLYSLSRSIMQSCRVEVYSNSDREPLFFRIFHGNPNEVEQQLLVQSVLLCPLQSTPSPRTTTDESICDELGTSELSFGQGQQLGSPPVASPTPSSPLTTHRPADNGGHVFPTPLTPAVLSTVSKSATAAAAAAAGGAADPNPFSGTHVASHFSSLGHNFKTLPERIIID